MSQVDGLLHFSVSTIATLQIFQEDKSPLKQEQVELIKTRSTMIKLTTKHMNVIWYDFEI